MYTLTCLLIAYMLRHRYLDKYPGYGLFYYAACFLFTPLLGIPLFLFIMKLPDNPNPSEEDKKRQEDLFMYGGMDQLT